MPNWRTQAKENLRTWGEQSWPTLLLATAEEAGELAQAILEHYAEDGDADRIPEELTDLAALGYQIHWKRTGYPDDVDLEPDDADANPGDDAGEPTVDDLGDDPDDTGDADEDDSPRKHGVGR